MAVTSMGRSSISAPGKTNRASGNLPLPNARVSGTTGSPVTTTYNGRTLYIFKGDGSVTFPGDCVVDLLLVGGGGGGGVIGGGGGGAGALREYLQVPFKAGTYTVTIGAGGYPGVDKGSNTTWTSGNGDATSIGKYEAPGGGGGGSANGDNAGTDKGNDGACGGGGSWNRSNRAESGSGGSGTDGFTGGQGEYLSGGGGAGMGENGSNGASSTGGDGGDGITTDWISTTIATANSIGEVSGSDVYFSGGGGGYGYAYNRNAIGGLGGGADCLASGYSGDGAPGGTNTGGGASGAGGTDGDRTGGSGLLIVRV